MSTHAAFVVAWKVLTALPLKVLLLSLIPMEVHWQMFTWQIQHLHTHSVQKT